MIPQAVAQRNRHLPVEQRAELMRMALAEVGAPVSVWVDAAGVACFEPLSEREAVSRAAEVVGVARRCRPCRAADLDGYRFLCTPDSHAEGCEGWGWDL